MGPDRPRLDPPRLALYSLTESARTPFHAEPTQSLRPRNDRCLMMPNSDKLQVCCMRLVIVGYRIRLGRLPCEFQMMLSAAK